MKREAALKRFPGFGEDTVVRSVDGEKLGTVIFMGDDHFVVEKGMFFPKDFTLRYDEVEGFRNGELFVNRSKEDLQPWREVTYSGWTAPGTGIGMFGGGAFGSTPDLMPQPVQEVNGSVGLEGARPRAEVIGSSPRDFGTGTDTVGEKDLSDIVASGTGESEAVVDPNAVFGVRDPGDRSGDEWDSTHASRNGMPRAPRPREEAREQGVVRGIGPSATPESSRMPPIEKPKKIG